jgi:hypothetical protein
MTIREMERKKRRSTRIFGATVMGLAALLGSLTWVGVLPLDALLAVLFLAIIGAYDLFRKLP